MCLFERLFNVVSFRFFSIQMTFYNRATCVIKDSKVPKVAYLKKKAFHFDILIMEARTIRLYK